MPRFLRARGTDKNAECDTDVRRTRMECDSKHCFWVHLSRRLKCTIVITRSPSSVRPLLIFHIFDFSSKPLNRIQRNFTGSKKSTSSTKLVFFGLIEKTRWPPWPLIGWDINFRLLLWKRWTEFNEIWQEARSQCPLLSLCFSGRSEKQDDRPGLWLAETFSTSPLKPLNGIKGNLTGSKISTSSIKFVFFRPIRKTRWPPWFLIGWDIFDFSSETAERNSTKVDRKQDVNVLYHVCVLTGSKISTSSTKFVFFSGRSKKQDGCPGLWLAETFSTSPLKPLNRIQWNLTGSKISTFSSNFVFFGPISKQNWWQIVLRWTIGGPLGLLFSICLYLIVLNIRGSGNGE